MQNNARPVVAIVMGSPSDRDVMSVAEKILGEFGVPCTVRVVSAHRSPDLCRRFARGAMANGIRVIIAGAGKAAHLAGVVASYTTLPVIGVPLDAGMSGLDALLSTAQMPQGVPVACMSIGRSGAVNAALLAVEVLALNDRELSRRLANYRRKMAVQVAKESTKSATAAVAR